MLIVEHRKNGLTGLDHVLGKDPAFGDDAGKRGHDDHVVDLRFNDAEVGLGRGDLGLVAVELRFGQFSRAFGVVILLLGNNLGLELLVDTGVIVERLCLVYRGYFDASGKEPKRSFGFFKLRP